MDENCYIVFYSIDFRMVREFSFIVFILLLSTMLFAETRVDVTNGIQSSQIRMKMTVY